MAILTSVQIMRKSDMKWIGRLAVFAIFAGGTAAVGAASNEGQAEALLEMMKARDRSIQEIVRSKTEGQTEAERKQLKAIIGDLFNFRRFSELSLGRYWKERTEEEQTEFTDLCRRLIQKNYADPKLYTKSEKIDYIGAEVNGADALVKTVVYYKSEQSTIDYKFHLMDSKWLIYDMVIDDLRVSRNNRSQFYKEIRKNSYESLVRKLKNKLSCKSNDGKG